MKYCLRDKAIIYLTVAVGFLLSANLSFAQTTTQNNWRGASTITLAENVPISDIPRTPYIIKSTETEIIPTIPAFIDADPNTINLKSKGEDITVHIELPRGHDINDIDQTTIKLNNQISIKSKPVAMGDYDSNGIEDLMVKFDRQAVQNILQVGEKVKITIGGSLKDGRLFEGSDTIKVISNGKPTSFMGGVLDFIKKSTSELIGLILLR